MMKALLVLGLFFSTYARADMRFTPVNDPKGRLPLALADERLAFRALNTDNGPCGAIFISNQGHLITARHCLQHCLFRQNLLVEKHDGQAIYYDVDRTKLGRATCDVRLDGVEERLVIEATSPGLIAASDRLGFSVLAPERFQQLVDQGYTDLGDFVIARLQNRAQSTACVPLAAREPTFGEAVHTLSLPTATHRSDGHNSDGRTLYYSAGHVLKSIYDNSCVRDLRLTPYIQDQLDHLLSPVNFLSTLDTTSGSSGSPVLSSTGELVGVLTNMYRHAANTRQSADEPENRFCAGSAIALDIPQILKLTQTVGFDIRALHCESMDL